jgi:3-oxoisoapionate kinase
MTRLLSYYGDDFTGSTDVMEALASHGVETVLFTRMPTAAEFEPFQNHAAIGLAGTSRSQTPAWMDEHLPPAFAWLRSLNARYCHYKICSTFDSSPAVGNIGRATEIGARLFAQTMVPLLVGAPQLKRYTFAGHLFAGYQGETYRIDRHPVMSRHPVTPMHQADLRLHLAQQTALPTSLANVSWPSHGLGLLDVHDAASQARAGERLKAWPGGFVVGSSGVEYALLAATHQRAVFAPLAPVVQTIVVSGSVSPTTERQIGHALRHGFEAVPVDALQLAAQNPAAKHVAVQSALHILNSGKSPLIHTALGPSSDEGEKLNAIPDGRRHIGEGLGAILKTVLAKTGLRRAIIAGGDSSSHALGQLEIYALTTRLPLPETPGSPLCTAHSNTPQLSGIDIALKGGQVGGDDYFVRLRDGQP